MKDITTTPTAELLAEWGLQKAAQPFAYPNKYYFIICETCGWKGSSEECGEHFYGDDSEAYCGNCGNTKLKDDIEFDAVRFAAIAAELDRRCSELGVGSKDGKPTFRFFTTDKPTEELVTEIVAIYVDSPPYTLEELRDLLAWLIHKGGNG